jgi:hypothetical protein
MERCHSRATRVGADFDVGKRDAYHGFAMAGLKAMSRPRSQAQPRFHARTGRRTVPEGCSSQDSSGDPWLRGVVGGQRSRLVSLLLLSVVALLPIATACAPTLPVTHSPSLAARPTPIADCFGSDNPWRKLPDPGTSPRAPEFIATSPTGPVAVSGLPIDKSSGPSNPDLPRLPVSPNTMVTLKPHFSVQAFAVRAGDTLDGALASTTVVREWSDSSTGGCRELEDVFDPGDLPASGVIVVVLRSPASPRMRETTFAWRVAADDP